MILSKIFYFIFTFLIIYIYIKWIIIKKLKIIIINGLIIFNKYIQPKKMHCVYNTIDTISIKNNK